MTIISNGDRKLDIERRLNAALVPYPSLDTFTATEIPDGVDLVRVIDGEDILNLWRRSDGEYTSADGSRWKIVFGAPDDEAALQAALDLLAEAQAATNSLLALAGVADPRDRLVPGMASYTRDNLGRVVGFDNEGFVVSNGLRIIPSTDRDAVGQYIWTISGADGHAIGLRSDGSITIFDQVFVDDTGRDAGRKYRTLLKSRDGRILLGLAADGAIMAGGGIEVPATSDRDAMRGIIPVAAGRDGVALGLDARTGRLVNAEPLAGPTYHEPTEMRGSWGQFNVRLGRGRVYATVQSRGYVCDVMQRQDIRLRDTAVAVGQIEAFLCIGQSNAGPGSGPAGGPPILRSDWPHHVLDAGTYGVYGGSSNETFLKGAYDLRRAEEPSSNGQSPAMMLGLALADLQHAEGERVPARAFFTSWEGARNLSDFFPAAGRFLHENAVFGVQAIKRICDQAYAPASLRAVLFVQGENSTPGYQAELEDWIDNVLPLYGAAVGQATPHLLLRQVNRANDAGVADPNSVAEAQLAVARARLGDGVTMTGPMYHLPLHDAIHADNIGRMMGGEMDAHAWRMVRAGYDWHPLWPVAGGVTRSGAVITIPMALPPGCEALSFDTDWVQAVANQGLEYSDSGSGATIASVEIDGSNIVATLTANPGSASGKIISYARWNGGGDAGWAGGRGLIYTDTGAASPFHLRGFETPPTIRAYCARFTESLS